MRSFAYLGVNQDTDDFAVADHLVEVVFDALLAQVISPLLAGLGESLSLARVPDVPETTKSLEKKKVETDLIDITR